MTKTRTFILIAVLILSSLFSVGFFVPMDSTDRRESVPKQYKIHVRDPFLNYTRVSNSDVSSRFY